MIDTSDNEHARRVNDGLTAVLQPHVARLRPDLDEKGVGREVGEVILSLLRDRSIVVTLPGRSRFRSVDMSGGSL